MANASGIEPDSPADILGIFIFCYFIVSTLGMLIFGSFYLGLSPNQQRQPESVTARRPGKATSWEDNMASSFENGNAIKVPQVSLC